MGRKPGKQPGAPGAHLAQVADPDHVTPHAPETCRCCGSDLSGAQLVNEEVRQVFEIPTPKIVVTEHRVYKLRCSCGEMNEGSFPPLTRAPTTYGPRVRGLGLYLLSRQHLPFERAVEAMADLLGVECSTGFSAIQVVALSALLETCPFPHPNCRDGSKRVVAARQAPTPKHWHEIRGPLGRPPGARSAPRCPDGTPR